MQSKLAIIKIIQRESFPKLKHQHEYHRHKYTMYKRNRKCYSRPGELTQSDFLKNLLMESAVTSWERSGCILAVRQGGVKEVILLRSSISFGKITTESKRQREFRLTACPMKVTAVYRLPDTTNFSNVSRQTTSRP